MQVNEPAIAYGITMTPQEYLVWESNQPSKNEYVGGRIIAMAGASIKHNRILNNLMREIGGFLKGKSCEIFASELKIFVKSKESYFYPDASIICGEPDVAEEFKDAVKNPSVIFEILSPSTTDYDLGRKFFYYMQIESFKEYITIDSTSLQVQVKRKQEDGAWRFEEYNDVSDIFTIQTIQMQVLLQDIYLNVQSDFL